MATVLVIVALASLSVTCVLALVVVKLLRDERRRSDARVIALTEMADAAASSVAPVREEPIAPWPVTRIAAEPNAPRHLTPAPKTPAPVSLDDYAFDGRGSRESDRFDTYEPSGIGAAPAGDLFAPPEQRSAWPRRAGVAAAVALVVVAGALAIRSVSGRDASAGSPPAVDTSAQQSGLLELLTLEHTQQGGALTIKGIVQNPRDGVPLSKIAATAFLFGADGAFLASGRAALDFTLLRPGDESAFVISVPVAAPVARYRVGFRGEDGRVIGHVDRRGAAAIAQNHGS